MNQITFSNTPRRDLHVLAASETAAYVLTYIDRQPLSRRIGFTREIYFNWDNTGVRRPFLVKLYDRGGEPVLTARLRNYRPIATDGGEPAVMPTDIDLAWQDSASRLHLHLSEMTDADKWRRRRVCSAAGCRAGFRRPTSSRSTATSQQTEALNGERLCGTGDCDDCDAGGGCAGHRSGTADRGQRPGRIELVHVSEDGKSYDVVARQLDGDWKWVARQAGGKPVAAAAVGQHLHLLFRQPLGYVTHDLRAGKPYEAAADRTEPGRNPADGRWPADAAAIALCDAAGWGDAAQAGSALIAVVPHRPEPAQDSNDQTQPSTSADAQTQPSIAAAASQLGVLIAAWE